MKKVKYSFCVVLIVLTLTTISLGTGVRSLGMGGAFTAVANDVSAIVINPAGLTQIEIVNIGLEAKVENIDLNNNEYSLKDLLKFISIDRDDLDSIKNGFSSQFGGYVGIATNRFGLSLLPTLSIESSKDGTSLDITQFNSSNLALALPVLSLFNNNFNLSLGTNIKLYRGTKEKYLIFDDSYRYSKETGGGEGLDFGILGRIGRLRTGIVIRDLYSDIFWHDSTTTEKLEPKLNAGLALDLGRKNSREETILAIDYTDLYLRSDKLPQNTSFPGKIRLGFEQSFLWLFKARGGVVFSSSEGAVNKEHTLGFGLKLGPVEADVAVLTKDLFQSDLTCNLGFLIKM